MLMYHQKQVKHKNSSVADQLLFCNQSISMLILLLWHVKRKFFIQTEWHIFEFTSTSNRVLLLQKIWTSKEQRISLAIVYHSFIFCKI